MQPETQESGTYRRGSKMRRCFNVREGVLLALPPNPIRKPIQNNCHFFVFVKRENWYKDGITAMIDIDCRDVDTPERPYPLQSYLVDR